MFDETAATPFKSEPNVAGVILRDLLCGAEAARRRDRSSRRRGDMTVSS